MCDGKQMCYNCSINPQSFDTQGPWISPRIQPHLFAKRWPRETCGEQKWGGKKWKTKRMKDFFSLGQRSKGKTPCHQRAVCNLSASEGRCRHIYSLCHEEMYFSPACGITPYQHLSPITECVPQQCRKIISLFAIPSMIRVFINVKFNYLST